MQTLLSPTEAEAHEIAWRWYQRIGLGFHPDTRGADHDPPLPAAEAEAYDRDMARLFAIAADPYEVCLVVMEG